MTPKFRVWVYKPTTREKPIMAYTDKDHGSIFITNIGIINQLVYLSVFFNGDKDDTESCGIYKYPDNCRLMQWTGLKDSNGKEIYEGDIVRVSYGNLATTSEWQKDEVRYLAEGYAYPAFELNRLQMSAEYNALQFYHENGIIEVIGNVYENPELLESEKEE